MATVDQVAFLTTMTSRLDRLLTSMVSTPDRLPPTMTSTLDRLPIELFLAIARELPVSALVALRSTNHALQTVVDKSAPYLSRHIQQQERHRLSKDVAKLDFSGLPIHTALRRHVACTGQPVFGHKRYLLFNDCIEHFAKWYLDHNVDSDIEPLDMEAFAGLLHDLTDYLDKPEQSGPSERGPRPRFAGLVDDDDGLTELAYEAVEVAESKKEKHITMLMELVSIESDYYSTIPIPDQQLAVMDVCRQSRLWRGAPYQPPFSTPGQVMRQRQEFQSLNSNLAFALRLPLVKHLPFPPMYGCRTQRARKTVEYLDRNIVLELDRWDYLPLKTEALMVAALLEDTEISWSGSEVRLPEE